MESESEMKKSTHKDTIDRFLGEVRTVCHTMIDNKYIGDSPVKLVKEALEYLDDKYQAEKKL